MLPQVAYFQIASVASKEKPRIQDALFNGVDVIHVRRHKARLVDVPEGTVRLAVADGVFSSNAPHLASRFWMEAFKQHGDGYGHFLRGQHMAFCDALLPEHFGSTTTFASACIDTTGLCRVCNVGDSRVYRISAEGIWTQVSHDHTVLAEMIEHGEADPAVEYSGLYYNLSDYLTADYDDISFKIFNTAFSLEKGESVLVCSDGLSDALAHDRLEQIWRDHSGLVDKLEALRHTVQKVKFYDDCSVVCASFVEV